MQKIRYSNLKSKHNNVKKIIFSFFRQLMRITWAWGRHIFGLACVRRFTLQLLISTELFWKGLDTFPCYCCLFVYRKSSNKSYSVSFYHFFNKEKDWNDGNHPNQPDPFLHLSWPNYKLTALGGERRLSRQQSLWSDLTTPPLSFCVLWGWSRPAVNASGAFDHFHLLPFIPWH